MNDKISFLPPEPIQLLDEDSTEPELDIDSQQENEGPISASNSNDSTSHSNDCGATITRTRPRRSSSINANFSFQKAHVSDCTIVNGDHGTKFAVWRITVFLEPNLKAFAAKGKAIKSKPINDTPISSDYERICSQESRQRNLRNLTVCRFHTFPLQCSGTVLGNIKK